MDLLKGPIREGSRGGANFKWDDVKDSKDREYYLGVSVKAPTGRWQQNRDIQWYSRGANGDDQAALDREKARAEEIRKIKEAENDALSAALGFKVARRQTDGDGLSQGEVDRAIKEAGEGGDERDGNTNEKGIGFGRMGGSLYANEEREVMAGDNNEDDVRWRPARADRDDGGDRDRRGDRRMTDKTRRHDGDSHEQSSRRRHHRSRSRDRDRDRHSHRRHRSRSRSRGKDRERRPERRRDRSRSPRGSPGRSHRDRGERRDHDRRDRGQDRVERRSRND